MTLRQSTRLIYSRLSFEEIRLPLRRHNHHHYMSMCKCMSLPAATVWMYLLLKGALHSWQKKAWQVESAVRMIVNVEWNNMKTIVFLLRSAVDEILQIIIYHTIVLCLPELWCLKPPLSQPSSPYNSIDALSVRFRRCERSSRHRV